MTIQPTDLFLVSSGGSKKCEAQNLNGKTGNVLVNRGGVSHKTGIENIPTTVLDDDLMLVNRGGASFKATGAEVQTLFPQGPAGATGVITDVVNSGSTSTLTLDSDRNLDTFTAGDGLRMIDSNGDSAVYLPITSAITAATTSTIADNWTAASGIQNFTGWKAVTYGNGRFVAVASNGSIPSAMYSLDGITWTGSSSLQGRDWLDVAYGNNSFAAVSTWGGNRMAYSLSNGITWQYSASGDGAGGPLLWKGVTFGGGKFMAVGSSYETNQYMAQTSSNGSTWYPSGFDMPGDWVSVAYGNDYYVAVGSDGQVMYTSGVATVWYSGSPAVNYSWTDITFGAGKFVAVSSNGNYTMWSTNGSGWSLSGALPGNVNNLQSVTYGDGRFVAVSSFGVSIYSADGVTWTQGATSSANMQSVVYGKDKFVSVGPSGVVWSASGGTLSSALTLALTPTSKDLKYFNPGDKVTQGSNVGYIDSIGTNKLVLTNVSGNWTTSVGQGAERGTSISGTGTYGSSTGSVMTVNNSNTQWVDTDNQRGNSYYATTQTSALSLAQALTVTDYGVMGAKARAYPVAGPWTDIENFEEQPTNEKESS